VVLLSYMQLAVVAALMLLELLALADHRELAAQVL
jgi:hypothetical protein